MYFIYSQTEGGDSFGVVNIPARRLTSVVFRSLGGKERVQEWAIDLELFGWILRWLSIK